MNEIEIIDKIDDLKRLRSIKGEVIRTLQYEKAARLRDAEKKLIIDLSKLLRCDVEGFSKIEEKIETFYESYQRTKKRVDKLDDLFKNPDSDTNI